MKVIGYTRVSTSKQADDGDSLDVQRNKLECYCELHDHELVDVYEDAGASAKDMAREGLQSALDAVEAGKADALVVYKLDRLTRNTEDLCGLIRRFDSQDINFKSVAESLDTSTAAGRMVVKILGVVSEWEREAIGERTSTALQSKAANGEYTGGKVPFGYNLDDDGSTLVEDPAEQEVIAAIFEYRDAGLSMRKIGKRLEADGFATRNGGKFWPNSIKRILDREQAA